MVHCQLRYYQVSSATSEWSIRNQPEVQLGAGTFDVCVVVFSAAAILLGSVAWKKCLLYTELKMLMSFLRRTAVHC